MSHKHITFSDRSALKHVLSYHILTFFWNPGRLADRFQRLVESVLIEKPWFLLESGIFVKNITEMAIKSDGQQKVQMKTEI